MGKAWIFGDDVNTDVIIPARYNITIDPEELAQHVFCEDRPEFPKTAKEGDTIVAGNNFGCGSSREHAPIAIKAAGIRFILAPSYARIFFRNAMNIGLPVLELLDEEHSIQEGDELDVDYTAGVVKNLSQNNEIRIRPVPEFMQKVIKAGGLASFVREHNIEDLLEAS